MPPQTVWQDTGRPLSRAERRRVAARLLTGLLPSGLDLARTCPECGSQDHGPLSTRWRTGSTTEPPLVSVSYAGPVVVVATAPASAGQLGLDAELDTAANRKAAAEALLTASGTEDPLEAWVRLEAAAKAGRGGLGPRWMPDDASGLNVSVTRVPHTPEDILLAVAVGAASSS